MLVMAKEVESHLFFIFVPIERISDRFNLEIHHRYTDGLTKSRYEMRDKDFIEEPRILNYEFEKLYRITLDNDKKIIEGNNEKF